MNPSASIRLHSTVYSLVEKGAGHLMKILTPSTLLSFQKTSCDRSWWVLTSSGRRYRIPIFLTNSLVTMPSAIRPTATHASTDLIPTLVANGISTGIIPRVPSPLTSSQERYTHAA